MDLKPETLAKIEALIPRYPQRRSAALPLLHLVQEDQGHISRKAIEWIAAKLELEPIRIYELLTFYPMLREKPIGRRHIKVCRTLSCALNGAYAVKDELQKALIGESRGDHSDDYTIEFVECIACCASAPVVQVDEVLHEHVRPDSIEKFADQIREETRVMRRSAAPFPPHPHVD